MLHTVFNFLRRFLFFGTIVAASPCNSVSTVANLKFTNQESADTDGLFRLSNVRYLLELCLFLFTNEFANIFLRVPGKSNVLSHTRPFNSKIKKMLINYSNNLNYFSWIKKLLGENFWGFNFFSVWETSFQLSTSLMCSPSRPIRIERLDFHKLHLFSQASHSRHPNPTQNFKKIINLIKFHNHYSINGNWIFGIFHKTPMFSRFGTDKLRHQLWVIQWLIIIEVSLESLILLVRNSPGKGRGPHIMILPVRECVGVDIAHWPISVESFFQLIFMIFIDGEGLELNILNLQKKLSELCLNIGVTFWVVSGLEVGKKEIIFNIFPNWTNVYGFWGDQRK